ncbi:LOW QUALITY PROTEIN: exonuclease mut-7 homolog [Hipposideros larvatus]
MGNPGAHVVRVLAESPPPHLTDWLVSIFYIHAGLLADRGRPGCMRAVGGLDGELAALGKRRESRPGGRQSAPLRGQVVCVPHPTDRVKLVEHVDVGGFPSLQRHPWTPVHACPAELRPRGRCERATFLWAFRCCEFLPVTGATALHACVHIGSHFAQHRPCVTQQHLAALRYLCYKRFVERSMFQENWAEHVRAILESGSPAWCGHSLKASGAMSPRKPEHTCGPGLWMWLTCACVRTRRGPKTPAGQGGRCRERGPPLPAQMSSLSDSVL